MTGSLVIVGLGIHIPGHLTSETSQHIQDADHLFYLTNGEESDEWVASLNPVAENLASCYALEKRRIDSYQEMVDKMLAPVHEGKRVCAAFYGHPGVFVKPSHAAIRQARVEGLIAQMLPGVSAEDCLFADLGIDPADKGCQSYEATDFLVRPRKFDTTTRLILWQVGVVGHLLAPVSGQIPKGLALLVRLLQQHYGDDHSVFIYEAATKPGETFHYQYVPLSEIKTAKIRVISTMYVPPTDEPTIDQKMMEQLGLAIEDLQA